MTVTLSPTLQEIISLDNNQLGVLLDNLTHEEALTVLYDWSIWARASQRPPASFGKEHSIWLLVAGRGFGKTRVLSEMVRAEVESGRSGRIGIIAETAADARDVIVEGTAGILRTAAPWFMPRYEPSKRRLTWPNGARATLYSADDPEQLRGPEHDFLAADELGKWRYAETWSNAMFGLRLGRSLAVGATTPRRTPLMLELMNDPNVIITNGTTYENISNLSATFINQIVRKYEGTEKGKQELLGLLLEQLQGALWSYAMIDNARLSFDDVTPDMERIVIGIDPAVTSHDESDETGINVSGRGIDKHGYVLADLSGRYAPAKWAEVAIDAYDQFNADAIVAEVNNGGDMVEHTIRTVRGGEKIKIIKVRASRGKIVRAEPVSALYEQQLIHHVGSFALLEEQMTNYIQGALKSPDRLDALVWALTELFPNERPKPRMIAR